MERLDNLVEPKSREEVTKITLTNARHYVAMGMVTTVGIAGIQAIWRINFFLCVFLHVFSTKVMHLLSGTVKLQAKL